MPNTRQCGAPRILLLLGELIEYICATFFCQLDNFSGRQWSLLVDDVLDELGVGQNMQDIHQWYTDMRLFDHFHEAEELFIFVLLLHPFSCGNG